MSVKNFASMAGRASAHLGFATALAIPAVLLTIESAAAGGTAANVSCTRSGSSVSCAAQWGGPGGNFPRIVQVPLPKTDDEIAKQNERDRKWSAYCQPTLKPDRYGVNRYFYAVSGCEFGRSTD